MTQLRIAIIAAAFAVIAAPAFAWNDHDAAKCVSMDTLCPTELAQNAEHWCRAGVKVNEQSPCCLQKACEWCSQYQEADLCKEQKLRDMCLAGAYHNKCDPSNPFPGTASRDCYQTGERAQGAPGMPYVQWKKCCDSNAYQTEVPSKGYGKFCVLGSSYQHSSSQNQYSNSQNQYSYSQNQHGDSQNYEQTHNRETEPKTPSYETGAPQQRYEAEAPTPTPSAYPSPPAPETKQDYAEPSKEKQGDAACNAWIGSGDKVVIATRGSATGNWRDAGDGIQYKPWDWDSHSIDGEGSSAISYKFTVDESGNYYVTLKSNAVQSTEFNDCWLMLPGGTKAEKQGSSYETGGWVKAYQNRGQGANEIYTKDHDPHQLSTGYLEAGRVHEIQVAGRSSQFSIERIVLVKCEGTCLNLGKDIGGLMNSPSPYNSC